MSAAAAQRETLRKRIADEIAKQLADLTLRATVERSIELFDAILDLEHLRLLFIDDRRPVA